MKLGESWQPKHEHELRARYPSWATHDNPFGLRARKGNCKETLPISHFLEVLAMLCDVGLDVGWEKIHIFMMVRDSQNPQRIV